MSHFSSLVITSRGAQVACSVCSTHIAGFAGRVTVTIAVPKLIATHATVVAKRLVVTGVLTIKTKKTVLTS